MLASFAAWIAHFFLLLVFFFFNDTATTEIYTLSLHDALPICGHRQAPLSKGTLEGHVIECPLHFATFDVRTGKLLSGPVAEDVPTYQVQVKDDTVYVKRAPPPSSAGAGSGGRASAGRGLINARRGAVPGARPGPSMM